MGEWFPKRTLGSLPARAAAHWGEREALVFGTRRWTFRQLDETIDRVARALMASGVGPGDKVAVWMTNRPEWVFLMFAIAKVGAVTVPLNTRYRSADVGYTLRQSDARTLVCMERSGPVNYIEMFERAADPDRAPGEVPEWTRFPRLRQVVLFSDTPGTRRTGTVAFQDWMEESARVPVSALRARAAEVNPDDLLVIAYTSGTTGDPKGVMHSHITVRNVLDCANRMGITHQDVILNYLPLFHAYAYSSCAMMSLLTGARQVLVDSFDAEVCCDWIARERCTVLHGFDTHYRDLLAAQARHPRDLSSLRIGSLPAGSESSTPVAEQVQRELCPTVSGYGMTEVWTFATQSFANSTEEQRVGASGFPSLGYEIRIVDPDTGETQLPDVPGEILIRGYMVTRGYYKKAEATRELVDADGWLHSGDAGLLRPDGHLQFLGRYKDMLKVGGENVSPAEVEAFLVRHPAVDQVAVVGVADPRLAEVPVAFVVKAKDTSPPSTAVIHAHCKGQIASFKIPRHIFYVDALPMTPSGKVQKHKLREQARHELTQQATAPEIRA